jgi:xanthine/uracil permease
MSTIAPAEQEGGYFPRWKEKTGGVIMPEERLPWGQTIISGLQHSVAMAGATIIAPLLMGFDPNLALLFSGVGTLIFFVMVGGRVPSYLGSSFSFIAVVIAASGYSGQGPNPGIDIALGGIVAAGGSRHHRIDCDGTGIGWVELLMPPVVTGPSLRHWSQSCPGRGQGGEGSQFDA